MIAILEETLQEIKHVWEHCGYHISEKEIFEIMEEALA